MHLTPIFAGQKENNVMKKATTVWAILALVAISCTQEHVNVNRLVENYAQVTIPAPDLTGITDNGKEVLKLYRMAADEVDKIYWQQYFGPKEEFLSSLSTEAERQYASINYGPWDRIDGKAFLKGYGPKPAGAGFYPADMTEAELNEIPSLQVGLIVFTVAAVVLGLICPFMVRASETISEITGLGTSFVGSTLVAFVTSLPEMVTSISAISIGAADMALGNLFGSNMFNMFGIGIADIFYTKGRFLSTVDNSFIVVGMLGVLMTSFGLIGNIVKFKRVGRVIDIDSIIMALMYFAGMYLLFVMSR